MASPRPEPPKRRVVLLSAWLPVQLADRPLSLPIVLVALVRLILHPLTKSSQVNMMKMQKSMGRLQPKMEEIKRKFTLAEARRVPARHRQ